MMEGMEVSQNDVILCALSGGVDSTVTAYILKDEFNATIVGGTHYIWPDSRCCSLDVLERARRTCKMLDIPYFVIDLEKPFRKYVVDDFIKTYLNGRTPNPCIICNEKIRFDIFYHEAEKKLRADGILGKNGILYMSTGHYARIVQIEGKLFIKRGIDPVKDQSYMLYRLSPQMLKRLILPLGEFKKSEVFEMADNLGLSVSHVPESQDACFIGESYSDFLSREAMGKEQLARGLKKGRIVTGDGEVLGYHNGYMNYTIGQRRGLNLGSGPWYVESINSETNTVVVARREDALKKRFVVSNINWFIDITDKPITCRVKVRYQSEMIDCIVFPDREGSVTVEMARGEFVTPGQSAVFYRDDVVLGGGIILSVMK